MPDDTPVLELRGITKRFPGVVANDSIDFDLDLRKRGHLILAQPLQPTDDVSIVQALSGG